MIVNSEKLVLGTAQLGMDYGINNKEGKPSLEKAYSILDVAYESNIKILDTASVYGDSEIIIGEYMKRKGRYFKIATKLSKYNSNMSIEKHVDNELLKSLKRLNVDHIDYYFIHSFDDIIKYSDIIKNILENREKGKVSKIGVSIYDVEELEYILERLEFIDIVQIPYSILDLRWEKTGVLRKAKEKGIEVFARSVFLQGLVFLDEEKANKIHPKVYDYISLLNRFCYENEISVQTASLMFTKINNCIDYTIVGCENPNQLISNLQSYNINNTLLEKKLFDFVISNFQSVEKEIIDPRIWPKL